jgi:hypothetical protein
MSNRSSQRISIGVLMLDTQFPRIPGDIGNAETWAFNVMFQTVRTATPDQVVTHDPAALLPAFIEAGNDLIARGASGLTTSCGFLALYQEELAAAFEVPFASSPLLQVSAVRAMLSPGKEVGVFTIAPESLTADHLLAVGAIANTKIGGLPEYSHFKQQILGNTDSFDVNLAREEHVNAALNFCKENPTIGALVLECTNMAPYASAMRQATGLPVFTIVSFMNWFHSSLSPVD